MRRLKKNYYLAIFWGIVGILGMVRWIFDIETPQVDNDSVAGKVSTEQTLSVTTTSESNTNSHIAQEENKEAPAKSKRKVHPIYSVPSFSRTFPDLQDVHVVSARKWGVSPVRNRQMAEKRKDELVFVGLYTDLLKVRFPEGFDVTIDVPEDKMARFVPPCSIQLLIENATKHNAVGPDNPLTVKVEIMDDNVRVSNNLVPKMTQSPSTGLGQKYIRQLYMDMSGKQIDIEQTEDEYCVTLPLL